MKNLNGFRCFSYPFFLILLLLTLINNPIAIAALTIQEAELIQLYPSDNNLFVQGLEFNAEGELILGTGMYGASQVGRMNLEEGYLEEAQSLDSQYFGEGLTVTDEFIWQLTWRENTVFQRDKESLEIVDQISYEGEGWGLAYDKDRSLFWMTDGSNRLQMRDDESFELIDEIEVTLMDEALFNLNELEYANGVLWANVWYQNFIVAIDPETGSVINYYDVNSILDGLDITDEEREKMDSLNGIAHHEGDFFFITGKLYPYIMEVKLPLN